MFGKKNKEIAKLTDELAEARVSLEQMRAEYEKKLSDAKSDINARETIIKSLKSEIATLKDDLATARHGEDPETDAFYAAKFASAKAESESETVEDAAFPEPVAQTPEESKEAPRQVARNTKRKH